MDQDQAKPIYSDRYENNDCLQGADIHQEGALGDRLGARNDVYLDLGGSDLNIYTHKYTHMHTYVWIWMSVCVLCIERLNIYIKSI